MAAAKVTSAHDHTAAATLLRREARFFSCLTFTTASPESG
jgi:hypothetical protein